jgi:hypothetical protein
MPLTCDLLAPFTEGAAWNDPFMVAVKNVEASIVSEETGVLFEQLDEEDNDVDGCILEHGYLPDTKGESELSASMDGFDDIMKSTFAPHSYNTEMPHMVLEGACCFDVACAKSPTHWYRITASANNIVIVVCYCG